MFFIRTKESKVLVAKRSIKVYKIGPCADANRTDKTGIIFKEINNMETKIDIVTILKDKPENTKLYSPLFGYVYFSSVENGIIKVIHQGKMVIFFGDGRYYNYPESEPLLFPSKERRRTRRMLELRKRKGRLGICR